MPKICFNYCIWSWLISPILKVKKKGSQEVSVLFHKNTQVLLQAYQQCLLKNICTESLQDKWHFIHFWPQHWCQHLPSCTCLCELVMPNMDQRQKWMPGIIHHCGFGVLFDGSCALNQLPLLRNTSLVNRHSTCSWSLQPCTRSVTFLWDVTAITILYRLPALPDSHSSSFSLKSTSGLTP